MGKKPPVSLRKPPAPVDLTLAERFVQGAIRVSDVHAANSLTSHPQRPSEVHNMSEVHEVHEVHAARPPASAELDTPVRARRAEPSRPTVTTTVERQAHPVPGVSSVGVSMPTLTPVSAARAVLARKDGRELRRMTLYLPTDLARRLAVHCAEWDLDMSDVVTDAVREHLDRRPR